MAPVTTVEGRVRDAVPLAAAITVPTASTPAPIATRVRPPTDRDDDDDDDDDDDFLDKPRNRKAIAIGVGALLLGGGIAALVLLGQRNAESYYVTCQAERIIAEQGRAFPPWGTSGLEGKEWRPIKIPPEAQCADLETTNYTALSHHFRAQLVARAEVLLNAREVTKVDEAKQLLDQALLHARGAGDSESRQGIQRMLGDVAYWRASARLGEAVEQLADAAKQFEDAAAQRPRFVSDASAWALYIRKLADELRAGPTGAPQQTFPPTPPPDRPTAPPGVALPVEPDDTDAGSAEAPPPAPPDAGVPTGGVLL